MLEAQRTCCTEVCELVGTVARLVQRRAQADAIPATIRSACSSTSQLAVKVAFEVCMMWAAVILPVYIETLQTCLVRQPP